jgi:hypothetical protein
MNRRRNCPKRPEWSKNGKKENMNTQKWIALALISLQISTVTSVLAKTPSATLPTGEVTPEMTLIT